MIKSSPSLLRLFAFASLLSRSEEAAFVPPVESTNPSRAKLVVSSDIMRQAASSSEVPSDLRPNPNTYWIRKGRFMAGEYPGDKRGVEATRAKLGRYLDIANITTFVDLTHAGERAEYESILFEESDKRRGNKNKESPTVRYVRCPIRDFGIPTTGEMKDILDVIDDALDNREENVYVHCRGGIGRTGTTVGCYIARHGLHPQPLEEVNRLFRSSDRFYESGCSPETFQQEDFVRHWNES